MPRLSLVHADDGDQVTATRCPQHRHRQTQHTAQTNATYNTGIRVYQYTDIQIHIDTDTCTPTVQVMLLTGLGLMQFFLPSNVPEERMAVTLTMVLAIVGFK